MAGLALVLSLTLAVHPPMAHAANVSGLAFTTALNVGGIHPAYGGEPNVLVAPDGSIYASNVNGAMWKSTDRGSTWNPSSYFLSGQSTADCYAANCLICCGDFADAADAAGDIYGVGLATLAYNTLAKSADGGQSWSAPSKVGAETDRPWVVAGAGSDVYVAYHDLATQYIYVQKSMDGGATWLPPSLATTDADGLAMSAGNTFDGPLTRTADGTLYIAWAAADPPHNAVNPPYAAPESRIYVSIAAPGSLVPIFHSTLVYAPPLAVPVAQPTPSISGFPWVTVDQAGHIYVVWDEAADSVHENVYYAYSADGGATWSAPIQVSEAGSSVFATGAAGSDGRLDIAWYGATDFADPNTETGPWYVNFAQVTNADSTHPAINATLVDPAPNHYGGICNKGIFCENLVVTCSSTLQSAGLSCSDRSLLDFFQVTLDANGAANLVWADNGAGGIGNGNPGLLFARQNAGPSAYASMGNVPP
ncbi:MAG: hypothetical protein ACYDDF_10285 [Thermoplasmatota archaeon]